MPSEFKGKIAEKRQNRDFLIFESFVCREHKYIFWEVTGSFGTKLKDSERILSIWPLLCRQMEADGGF